MSIDAMAQMRASKARGLDRAVGMAIASYANPQTGLAFPSNKTLVSEWGFCERTIQRALRRLEELGELRRQPEFESRERRRVYLVGSGQLPLLDVVSPLGDKLPDARLLTRAGSNGERGKNSTPQPPKGGLAPDPFSTLHSSPQPAVVVERAAPARRRRTRRRPDAQGSVASEPCPLRHGHLEGELMKEWEQVEHRLRPLLGQQFELWFQSAHPHGVDGLALILALPPQVCSFAAERFGHLLATHAGRPLRLVGCEGLNSSAGGRA